MSLIPKINRGYQFTIPEHDRGVCSPNCLFYQWDSEQEFVNRPFCAANLDLEIRNQELIPGANCHPGVYDCRKRE